jgi:hypothetical protein
MRGKNRNRKLWRDPSWEPASRHWCQISEDVRSIRGVEDPNICVGASALYVVLRGASPKRGVSRRRGESVLSDPFRQTPPKRPSRRCSAGIAMLACRKDRCCTPTRNCAWRMLIIAKALLSTGSTAFWAPRPPSIASATGGCSWYRCGLKWRGGRRINRRFRI